ncbi:uncharacterized protein C20orf96 homolog isoform X1 [Ranitomeya variabilis]|uniref:uncharacterized protein C20orf96 homolog isoform X1 n=2 Tax=Ranitomeya variabilis TaxID=490064 RepID=UPI004056768A
MLEHLHVRVVTCRWLMTSVCFLGNGLTLDHSMSQRLMARGHHCADCSKNATFHNVPLPNHATGAKGPTKVTAQQKTADYQLNKNCVTAKNRLKKGVPVLLTYTTQSLPSLNSQCKRLEEENASMMRRIIAIEDEAMKSATQHLQQYNRAGSNVHAVQIWTEHQTRESQRDLEITREMSKERVNVVRRQLQNCEEKIQEAQKDLQQLRDYRDRGHSMKTLQAAELERQIRLLCDLHQDQAADVTALAQTEIEKLLESHQKVKDGILKGVVEQNLESLPLSVKRMCLQNQEMRSEIKAYHQIIPGLQDDIKQLLETGESLRKSWNEETDRLCRDLLLNRPKCPADEDVVLDIPLNQPMYI